MERRTLLLVVILLLSTMLLSFPSIAEGTDIVADVPVTIKTSLGKTSYTVVIPEGGIALDFEKTDGGDAEFVHEFSIGVVEVKNLWGKNIKVNVIGNHDNKMVFTCDKATQLPYGIRNIGGDALMHDSVLASFIEDDSVTAELFIKTEHITKEATYSGSLNFFFYVV